MTPASDQSDRHYSYSRNSSHRQKFCKGQLFIMTKEQRFHEDSTTLGEEGVGLSSVASKNWDNLINLLIAILSEKYF